MDKQGYEARDDFWKLADSLHKQLVKEERAALKSLHSYIRAFEYPDGAIIPTDEDKQKCKDYKLAVGAIYSYMWTVSGAHKILKKALGK